MIINYILALISGSFSGFSLGLTGGGGSILAVPLLVYAVGENVHLAIGTSLLAVGITALISSFSYMKQSLVKFKIALFMASPGIVSTYIGALINKQLKGPIILLIFSLLMMYIGYLMVKKKKNDNAEHKNTKISYTKILILGFITGFASGFFGIGGGFLLVPALFLGAKLTMKEAVATSLFIIFLFGLFGLASYEIQGRRISYIISAVFVIGGALGGYAGAMVAKRINQNKLRLIFSMFIILIGIAMFISNVAKVI